MHTCQYVVRMINACPREHARVGSHVTDVCETIKIMTHFPESRAVEVGECVECVVSESVETKDIRLHDVYVCGIERRVEVREREREFLKERTRSLDSLNELECGREVVFVVREKAKREVVKRGERGKRLCE